MKQKTLYDKIWSSHIVKDFGDGDALIYIDRHLIHEVTSPQAFEGLESANRLLWRKDSIKAVSDHNVPTKDISFIADPVAQTQLETLNVNCKKHEITHFDMGSLNQGIVHVTGPEQGWCLPGMTIVCGDSHTATNGAMAAMSWGIGTSEIEHVMATQCLRIKKSKNYRISVSGKLQEHISSKDMVLYIIGKLGTAGATGYAVEYSGEAVRQLSMEQRMTVCNMSIEAGGRIGLVAFDEVTRDYVSGKPFAPKGKMQERAISYWESLKSDENLSFA